MSRLLEWNNLQEATDYLTGETGETWTQRMVLDAGEKESFKVRFVLPPGVEAGREAEFIGDKPQLMPGSINALLNDGSVLVGWVPFTHPISKYETSLELKPRPRITFDEIRIRGVELEIFATKSRKTTQLTEPPNTEKVGAVKGMTKQEVIGAFAGLHFATDAQWSKVLADVPKWLEPCRVMKGSKKASALWSPVQIAVALYDKQIPIKKLDAVFVGLKDWTNEWQKASDYFRT